jgi:hypothetical protein
LPGASEALKTPVSIQLVHELVVAALAVGCCQSAYDILPVDICITGMRGRRVEMEVALVDILAVATLVLVSSKADLQ